MLTKQQMKNLLNPEIPAMQAPATANAAVQRCHKAWVEFLCKARLEGDHEDRAQWRARNAFRLAMPPLTGKRNVRDFIACTAYGFLLQAIDQKDVSKLLYAAQVACSMARRKKPSKKSTCDPVLTGK